MLQDGEHLIGVHTASNAKFVTAALGLTESELSGIDGTMEEVFKEGCKIVVTRDGITVSDVEAIKVKLKLLWLLCSTAKLDTSKKGGAPFCCDAGVRFDLEDEAVLSALVELDMYEGPGDDGVWDADNINTVHLLLSEEMKVMCVGLGIDIPDKVVAADWEEQKESWHDENED